MGAAHRNNSNLHQHNSGASGSGSSSSGHRPPLAHHYMADDERARRHAEYVANYRREAGGGYAVPSLPQPSHQISAGGVSASSYKTAHAWPSPSPQPNLRLAGPSASSMGSVSPVQTSQDGHTSRSRLQSSHAFLAASREAASREHHQQSIAHPSYLPTLHSHAASSPILSSNSSQLLPPSPHRQTSSGPPFGLTLGPITPSFSLSSSGGGGLMSPSGALGSRMSSLSSLNTPLSMPRFSPLDHQLTPGGMQPSSTTGPPGMPSKSWLDFPSPGSRPLFSPSHPSILSASLTTPTLSGTSSAPFWPGAAVMSSGSNSHSQKRKPTGDYFSGVMPSQLNLNEAREEEVSRTRSPDAAGREEKRRRFEQDGEDDERSSKGRMRSSTRELENDEGQEDDDDLEEDQLNEDEVGEHDDDALVTPLSLLAHASDAAATLKQGATERRNSFGKQRMGAATMGLISPPVPRLAPPRRWFDSGRLPHLGSQLPNTSSLSLHKTLSPILSRTPQRDYMRAGSGRTTSMAPPFGSLSRPASHAVTQRNMTNTPPGLGSIGRSRSYTTVELVNRPQSTFSPPRARGEEDREVGRSVVTDLERRAEVLGEGVYQTAPKFEDGQVGNSITPSTLDHEAWEYRDGRARTRKSFSGTSHSEESIKQNVVSSEAAPSSKSSPSATGTTAKACDTSRDRGAKDRPDRAKDGADVAASTQQPRRWQILRRPLLDGNQEGNGEWSGTEAESQESETLGASHRDFFALSIFHSKMDNELDMDPVQLGLVELREVEKLFDVFFARINPLLNMLDPFLHSVYYVRSRSALLTTVIAAMAARLSDNGRDAELAVRLERFWRHRLVPEVLLGGYKSVELSQAFLILSLYHKPTNRLSDDRSWQYLGFAIRIATEVGVNRITLPNESVRENEQVRRRVRNRSRLWISLFLSDRNLCFQTGRPWTISEDEMIIHSNLWHTEDFALPEDARLISSIKLTRVVGDYGQAIKDIAEGKRATLGNPYQWKEDVKSLQYCLAEALGAMERWRDVWCTGSLEDRPDGSQSQAVANSLEAWQPGAKGRYYYGRLNLCSRVLQALERMRSVVLATAEAKGMPERIKAAIDDIDALVQRISLDAWQCALDMMDTLLPESEQTDLCAAPNQTAIMAIYCALAALRLNRLSQRSTEGPKNPLEQVTVPRCKALVAALIQAGRTPKHRNGAATSYGLYLEGIVTLWESNVVQDGTQISHSDGDGEQEVKADEVSTVKQSEAGNVDAAPPMTVTVVGERRDKRPKATSLDGALLPMMPAKEVQSPLAPHSVGEEVWGSARNLQDTQLSGSVVASDPDAMDRMWDYLTTYPDPSSGFPLSLWQPHATWTAPTSSRPPNATAPTL